MSGVFVVKRVVLVITLALLLFGLGSYLPGKAPEEVGTRLQLVAPPFISQVQAQTIATYLDQEAGISAWAKGTPINITSVRSICRTIEIETPDYIICSVDVSSYLDHFDPHVYVHKDGWILAFYFRTNYLGISIPASKMLNVVGKTLENTLLSNTVASVANAASSSISTINYYDFRFPDATHMLFIAEDDSEGASFTLQIPCSYMYYEKSWALSGTNYAVFSLNGTSFYPNAIYRDDGSAYGVLPPINCGETYLIEVGGYYSQYGAIVITYRVP